MITLKTLKDATAQEVFNQVKNHLLKQGIKSVSIEGKCQYRYSNLKCAAGCLIIDDEYSPFLEDYTWNELINLDLVTHIHGILISQLQEIHDLCYVDEWEIELKALAKKLNLNF